MRFKSPNTPLEDIPKRFRGAFGRWRNFQKRPLQDRFWDKVKRGTNDECWPFIGEIMNRGYGIFNPFGSKSTRTVAHRIAWEIENGPIPHEKMACHRCDNRKCCNPSHIFIGTAKDNVQDMLKKGRGNHPKGERHIQHVLTEKQVVQIRAEHVPNVITYRTLAVKYGVSKSCIQHVVARHKWKHI